MPVVECVGCGQPFYLPTYYRDYKGKVRCEHCGKLLLIKFVRYKPTLMKLCKESELRRFVKLEKRRKPKKKKLKRRWKRRG